MELLMGPCQSLCFISFCCEGWGGWGGALSLNLWCVVVASMTLQNLCVLLCPY